MKALIQRVSEASVTIENETKGRIDKGFVVLLGITHKDTKKEADFVADKVANLRVFKDEHGKMNLSLKEVEGELLVISQFTLYGDCRKGRRPSFVEAARPEHAIPLYEYFVEQLKKTGVKVETGIFGAGMEVDIHNSGPVTLMIEK
ncbi:MAG: D-tyrosyl-tRNA(Tyr) deacylase [Victivallales bacterium]|nr:D-tyrosyl-tRNA(Tyr) deacylase [Victivallales bacterium]MCF7889394.1 D-tyrosyl-tRNA(Tyr) deacylase [Victivallales bacterium]